MSWYNFAKWFKKKSEVKMEARPIHINPGNSALLKRHVGRLVNLLSSVEKGDTRQEVFDEIQDRKAAIAGYGHGEIKTKQEARALFDRLGD